MRKLVLAAILALSLPSGSAAADPELTERRVEIAPSRPSGFWTSPRPATHGAYRWRLLGIGVVLAAGAGLLMLRLTRRASAERALRDK